MTIKLTNAVAKTLIQSNSHLGSTTLNTKMKTYVYSKRSSDGIVIFDINKMWTKMIQAASAFCSIENPSDVIVVSSKEFGKRAVRKFAELTGATPIYGRFIPGSFTNRSINKVKEPRLIISLDSTADKNTIVEAAGCNTPVISFCNSDAALAFVDLVIPMNNRSQSSIAAGFYNLANLIRFIKGEIDTVDNNLVNGIESFIYREKEEMIAIADEYEAKNAEKNVRFD